MEQIEIFLAQKRAAKKNYSIQKDIEEIVKRKSLPERVGTEYLSINKNN